MNIRDGAVFFSKNTEGKDYSFLLHTEERDEKSWRSYSLAASLIFRNGAWHPLSNSFPRITCESPRLSHALDFWPLDDDGKRMDGNIDTDLITVALRDAFEVTVPYTIGDPLDDWHVTTCGKGLAQLIWRNAPLDQAALLFDCDGVLHNRYPSRYGKTRADILERSRRRKNISSRLDSIAKQYEPIEEPLLQDFKSSTESVKTYQDRLPQKIKQVESFVRNTRRRAAVNCIDAFEWWLNGYPGNAPSNETLCLAYAKSIEHESKRASESIKDLGRTTISRLVQMAETIADLGPLISTGIAKSRYKLKDAALDAGKKDGTLRGAELQGRWHWAQNDIRKVANVAHLAIQHLDEIPKILDLSTCYSTCRDLAGRFDTTCQVDIHTSFRHKHSSALPRVRSRSIQNRHGYFSRYYAHDVIAWFLSNEYRKLAEREQRSEAQTSKQRVVTSTYTSNEKSSVIIRAASHITIMTSSKESHGYHDFLSEVDLTDVPHEVVSLGQRENAILAHLGQRTFHAGDIICIVRGGGDLLHPSFKPFDHFDSAVKLKELSVRGILVVTGIGHSRDSFVVERGATFVESTPVKAGQRVRQLLQPK